jgi:hypothetical protein
MSGRLITIHPKETATMTRTIDFHRDEMGQLVGLPDLEELRSWPEDDQVEFMVRFADEIREETEQALAYQAAFRAKVGAAAFERMLANPDPQYDTLREFADLEQRKAAGLPPWRTPSPSTPG